MRALTPAMLLPLAACNIGWSDDDDGPAIAASGSGTTRSYAAADFTKIDQRGPDDIDVRETPASRSGIAGAERLAAALRTDATPSVYVVPRGSATGARVDDPGDVDALDRAVRRAAAKAR